jgi:Putative Ice-binding-like adhesive domain
MRIIESNKNYHNIETIERMNKLSYSRRAFALLVIAAFAVALADYAKASVVDLGDAAGFSVLTYNSNNTSDSAFQGGPIGVVNGNWTQSGGAQTNTQQPEIVYLSPGHTNNGPAVLTTVYNASLLNSAWTDATNASAMLASLAPTQTLGAITSGQTITEAAVGNYVLSISSINLNQSALTLSAPAGSTFVLNISGNVTLNGGSQGNGLLLAGGLTSNDVVYNLTGVNSNLTTSGGGNAQQIFGTVLATGSNASVNLHPGQINGEIIATTLTTSSGALAVVPEVTPSSVIFGFLGLVVALSARRALMGRVRAMATQRKTRIG